jgi:DNA (cytosine-5)-methyltransferase 1
VGKHHRYRLVDLFAGCGGMTRGFVDTDRYEPMFAVEMDPDAASTYVANFGNAHMVVARIEDVRRFPRADVVIGGPPCQPFSPLNRKGVGFERRDLWRHYLRALEESCAQAFVMENVPELLRSVEYEEFRTAAEDRLGFRVEARILNAADYGVSQRRRRAIVIGLRKDSVTWPKQTHYDSAMVPLDGKPWATFREAVEGLPLKPNGKNWHIRRSPRPSSIRRYKAVPANGGNRFQMQENLDRAGLADLVPQCWRDKPTGTTDVFGRLWWDQPALTIRTEFYKPEKGRYLHPTAHRPITVREAARCMGFTDDFAFPLNQRWTSVARQIGNAVPPPLARRIAEVLAAELDVAGAASSISQPVAA